MKRILIFFLALAVLFGVNACGAAKDKALEPEGAYGGDRSDIADGEYKLSEFPADAEMAGAADSWNGSGNGQYAAGTLTASELNDLAHWNEFSESLAGDSFTGFSGKWNLYPGNRIRVTVTNQNGEAVGGARAELLSPTDDVLYTAVTDCRGDAYLYFAVRDPQEVPGTVRVSKDGKTAEFTPDGTGDYTVTLDAEGIPASLDLLLMIDTTGSMGDELEYLKTELADVVARVREQCQIDVRVSVNFYRDRGDEYIVRSNGFSSDIGESVRILSAQSANGGGDYPEAVHTALEDAVTGHEWREDSVKLVLLVLDAPPHNEQSVKESIGNTLTTAAQEGIRIIPVASSGVNDECDFLFRTFAALTGGTYTFLTDDSGIGSGSHADPDTSVDLVTEYLNDLLVRVICGYCGVEIAPDPIGTQTEPATEPLPDAE